MSKNKSHKKPVHRDPKTPQVVWWQIQAEIRPGTINMLRIVAIKVLGAEKRGYNLGQFPYMGDSPPEDYFSRLILICNTVAVTIRALRGDVEIKILLDTDAGIKHLVETVVRGVMHKIKGSLIGPDGKRQLKVEQDGAILEIDPDEVEVVGRDVTDKTPELDLDDLEGQLADVEEEEPSTGPVLLGDPPAGPSRPRGRQGRIVLE